MRCGGVARLATAVNRGNEGVCGEGARPISETGGSHWPSSKLLRVTTWSCADKQPVNRHVQVAQVLPEHEYALTPGLVVQQSPRDLQAESHQQPLAEL